MFSASSKKNIIWEKTVVNSPVFFGGIGNRDHRETLENHRKTIENIQKT